jgi:hypothetical protein
MIGKKISQDVRAVVKALHNDLQSKNELWKWVWLEYAAFGVLFGALGAAKPEHTLYLII